ncbi:MAG TPA: hypothetical protein VG225_01725 [Terracidiphilus sp.]|jgi:hypothetical protein|nr:hypothetical protein [Terracidiphilus sp.]
MALTFREIRPGAPKSNPFTIAIVANPVLEAPWNSGAVIADPIMGSLPIFQAAAAYIDSSLFGGLPGQREAVLADPTIATAIRVVSLFDDTLPVVLGNALAAQDGSSFTLVARRSGFRAFLAQYPQFHIQTDVVYAVSASPTHTRASAWFTSDDDAQPGVPFTLDGNAFLHRFYNLIPGTIAIPANSTSLTAIHEFGHAISSYTNGAIVDLYVDSNPGLNNKRGRPIPAVFANYSGTTLASDLTRDGLGYPGSWSSYHCELVDPTCPAVMDNYWLSRSGSVTCQHDRITRQYILDRVRAKAGRP